MQLLTIVAMLFGATSVMFALQNNVPVAVTFLLWHFDGSLAMVLLIAMALGALIVALVSTPSTVRRQWAINRQQKHIEELERTCGEQKDRLAVLARATGEVAPRPQEQPQFVGLKQLIAGESSDDQRTPPPSP
ncbi:MAG TPA: LapA family protein [Rhodocyclaceae bacterium]|nr:LapA family protein [Rhodocyclaceae bacterium]